MPTFHLLTPAVVPGDAVTQDLLGMLDWLREHLYQAEAYAEHRHPALQEKVLPLSAYRGRSRDDLLLYHHSVGWEAGLELFMNTRNRKLLKYHSVTPPRFYRRYHPEYAQACSRGIVQTRLLLQQRPERVLADSDFNRQELLRAGAEVSTCAIVPPFHALNYLDVGGQDETLARQLRNQTNILFVGRVAPNKGHMHLLRAFAHYRHQLGLPGHLWLVGSLASQLHGYHVELRAAVARLRIDDAVHFTGSVAPRTLRTYYSQASVFLCASEHEGFCVPLVEAMRFQTPIVAVGGSAVAGTLGSRGLVWDSPDPVVLAESIRLLVQRADVRAELVRRQWERYQQYFTTEAIGDGFERALEPVLCGVEVFA